MGPASGTVMSKFEREKSLFAQRRCLAPVWHVIAAVYGSHAIPFIFWTALSARRRHANARD